MQLRAWQWRNLGSAVSKRPAGLLRALKMLRLHGTKHDGNRLSRREAGPASNAWQFYLPLFAASLPSGRLVMRRKVDGKWHYRQPTAKEEADYMACESW
jgi:hypothetical protein